MIHLQSIIGPDPRYTPVSKTHWELTADWEFDLLTSEGVLHAHMSKGWVTDFRSGSAACDLVVPKIGNSTYRKAVCFHDLCYSGWLSKDLADELLYQGMILSGQSVWRAKMAWAAVHIAGRPSYFNMDDALPPPYTGNRALENLTWTA